MAFVVDETGITIQGQSEIATERSETLKDPAVFGPSLDTGARSTAGRLVNVEAEREAVVQMVAEAILLRLRPSIAEGYHLDTLGQLNGVKRDAATFAESDLGFIVTTGAVTVSAGKIVRNNRTLQDWTIIEDVVAPSAGTYPATIRARVAGVQEFLATDSWTIVTPVLGWSTFGASLDIETSDMGSDRESDEDYREKRKQALLAAGNDWEGIQAGVALVPGVSFVGGFNNTNLFEVDGVPGGAVHLVAEGGDEEAIAQAIYERLPPGTQTFGDVNVPITMSNGQLLAGGVNFSRPDEIDVWLRITVSSTGAEYAYNPDIVNLLKETVLEDAMAMFGDPGIDVVPGALTGRLWDVSKDALTGRPTLTSILVERSLNGSTWSTAVIPIAHTDKATFALARISVVGP
jgi:uncharacterized phage protein gp47/JayE